MNRFAPVLKELDSQLALPQSARSRVLLEVAADLEDAFDHAVARGQTEHEAELSVVTDFKPTADTLAQLERIHGGPLACFLDGVSSQARSILERFLLAMVAIIVLTSSGGLLLDLRIFTIAGDWAWLTTGLTLSVVLAAIVKTYQLFLKQDHRPHILRRGMGLMVALASSQVLGGLGLVVISGYTWLTAVITVWPGGDHRGALMLLMQVSALAAITLFGAVVSCLAWFFVSQKIAIIEEQEAELLLQIEGGQS